jgi:Zn-dependent M28 family amino/carboxypeptidase
MKFILGVAVVVVVACSNTGVQKQEPPYPSLAAQRAGLVKKPYVKPARILDSAQIITDLLFLASDSCEGRSPGSTGHLSAEERVLMRMRYAGVDSFDNALLQVTSGARETRNIVGWIKGKKYPTKFIVISAHYDHLGKRGAKTYYGADDNASGSACLLSLAKYFRQHPHDYSLIFAAFDREETGLEGAFAFVKKITAEKKDVVFNLNMDMIARSDKNEIFASGLSHYPANKYLVDGVQDKVNVMLLMGHDTGNNMDDWTMQSDQAAFYKASIPFLYIGVEDHPDYHKPTDTADKISFSRYIENCNMIALMIDMYK